jgi:nitrous oxidase accessory protein
VHGGRDSVVRGNVIVGRRPPHERPRQRRLCLERPGTVIEGNDIRWGRDGIFSNASQGHVYRNNLFRDLRFAVHYMYTNDSEVRQRLDRQPPRLCADVLQPRWWCTTTCRSATASTA